MSVDQYREFSKYYHWFYTQEVLENPENLINENSWLNNIPHSSKVLDTSCGTGIRSIGLAMKGIDVKAADNSQGMLDEARKLSDKLEIKLSFIHSDWLSLGRNLKNTETFDYILCLGNSITHAKEDNNLLKVFREFKSLLDPNGKILLSVRNWDKIIQHKSLPPSSESITRGNEMCVINYDWDFDFNFNSTGIAKISFKKDRIKKTFDIKFIPLAYHELLDVAGKVGLALTSTDFDSNPDFYNCEFCIK